MEGSMILKTGAIYMAVTTMAAGAWYAGDWLGVRPVYKKELLLVMEQAEQNTQSLMLLNWKILEEKRTNGNLTFLELQEYCTIAKLMDYKGEIINSTCGPLSVTR